ncbi:trypsin-like peptidase domain-containing protein [Haliea sp. E17]
MAGSPGNLVLLAPALALLAVLAGCSSSPGGREATGSRAENDLQSGVCPPSIIDSRGRNAEGDYRYGKGQDTATLARLRDREVANCARAASSGDTRSLSLVAAFYRDSQRTGELLPILEAYVENGSDRATLANSGTFLYRAYASGRQGVPADPAKAFRYLSVAVNNGAPDLEMTYAQALVTRGLYDDALRALEKLAGTQDPELRCEAELSLAELYFGASPRHENWNIGYYYWRRGLELAQSPDWGSCAKDNFVYGERYSYESNRKRYVDERIALMSSAQRQVIDEARRNPSRGYPFVAALSFQRPAGAAARGSAESVAARPAGLGGWPAWRPLSSSLCGLYAVNRYGDWSNVFEINSPAVWGVDSRNGNSQVQGSAIAVGPQELVTNCHVIENPGNITLRRIGQNLPAKVAAADREGDRCILSVDRPLPSFVQNARAHNGLRVGEDVAAIGNPRGLETSLSRGIVAQKRSRDNLQLIQTDTAISAGSSGGGLFDRSGNLVGITTFTISSGQSLNFAIAIDEFCH